MSQGEKYSAAMLSIRLLIFEEIFPTIVK